MRNSFNLGRWRTKLSSNQFIRMKNWGLGQWIRLCGIEMHIKPGLWFLHFYPNPLTPCCALFNQSVISDDTSDVSVWDYSLRSSRSISQNSSHIFECYVQFPRRLLELQVQFICLRYTYYIWVRDQTMPIVELAVCFGSVLLHDKSSSR